MSQGNGRTDGSVFNEFQSPSKGRRDFMEVIEDIIGFVSEDDLSRYAIVVGTDSEEIIKANGHPGIADFVSVITVHRIGKFGRYFWKKMSSIKTFDRHDRLIKEASFSVELAQKLVNQLRERLNGQLYDFEIHLDIGHNGPTKSLIQEIVGMVTGNGFIARIKPESYAATKVADKYV